MDIRSYPLLRPMRRGYIDYRSVSVHTSHRVFGLSVVNEGVCGGCSLSDPPHIPIAAKKGAAPAPREKDQGCGGECLIMFNIMLYKLTTVPIKSLPEGRP